MIAKSAKITYNSVNIRFVVVQTVTFQTKLIIAKGAKKIHFYLVNIRFVVQTVTFSTSLLRQMFSPNIFKNKNFVNKIARPHAEWKTKQTGNKLKQKLIFVDVN